MGAPTEAPSCPFSRSVPGWHGQQQPCAGPDCSTRLGLTSCSACRKEAGVSFCTWVTASRCRRKARKRCRKARKCSAAGGTQWWPHGGHGRRRPGPRCDARPGSIRNVPIPRSRSLGVSSCAASWPEPLRCAALILPALRLASGTDTPGRPPPPPRYPLLSRPFLHTCAADVSRHRLSQHVLRERGVGQPALRQGGQGQAG